MTQSLKPLLRQVTDVSRNIVKRMGLKETVLRLSYEKGIPPSLDEQMLRDIVRERTGGAPAHVVYRRMSGWKKSGAYRLIIRTESNVKLSLIFKNALYSRDEIPALQGLPIQPGIGEYLFLKNATGPGAKFLPATFVASEVTPNEHYQYVMEDLSGRYRTFIDENDRDRVCRALPEIHAAFLALLTDGEQARLLRMDRGFADRLLPYAHRTLEAYEQARHDDAVAALLEIWPAFTTAYERSVDAAYGQQPLTLIHGDCNASNVLFHRKDRSIKFIDLEWAGWGFPHHDLVSLLRGSTAAREAEYLQRFSEGLGRNRLEKDWTIYRHCGLQRALLDAAYVGKQFLETEDNGPQWFPAFVSRACAHAMAIMRTLEHG